MIHKFNYVKVGLWYRPIIPVILKLNNIEFGYLTLLDSGADFNIFHSEIARILKIDLHKLKKPVIFNGINNSVESKGYFTSIDISVDSKFFNTPVVFSNDISDNGYGILGQQGFSIIIMLNLII